MDFSLIERHPWATTGIVLGGGFLLYLVFRGRGGSGGSSAGGVVYTGADPASANANAALAAQAQSTQAGLSAIQLQGATQIQLASIGADLSKFQTAAAQEAQDRQTQAQYGVALGTIGGQVELANIQANVQMKIIDAIVNAFRGGSSAVNPGNVPTGTPYGVVSNPVPQVTSQITPPIPVSISNGGSSDGGQFDIIPGGTQLVPYPNLVYQGAWPDANVVQANVNSVVDWQNKTLAANAANNRAQCLANAERSRGYANYDSLVAACG